MRKLGTAGGLCGQGSAPNLGDAKCGLKEVAQRREPQQLYRSGYGGGGAQHILYPRSVYAGESVVTEHLGTPLGAGPQTPAQCWLQFQPVPQESPSIPGITGWAPRSGSVPPRPHPLTLASGRSLMRKRFLLKLSFLTFAQLKALILVKP